MQRGVIAGKRRSQALAGRLLEEVCGRAALPAGEVESHAGAGFGLELDGGMADDLGEDQRCGVEGQVAVPDRRDRCRVGGAALRDG